MILNVYKPKEWTSFDVVAKIRGMLRKSTGKKKIKVGHAGTLDPLAEGVLIILTGHDTKKQDLIMKKPKEYVANIAFGATSPTYDLEGGLAFTKSIPALENIKAELPNYQESFIGVLEQKVPVFSAAKVDGQRLYNKARQGEIEDVEIPTKTVVIHRFEFEDFFEQEFEGHLLPVLKCRIICGSGTYVRSIAHDLGEMLGCGGVLTHLVRTRVGEFKVENAFNIDEIQRKISLQVAHL